MEEDLGALEFAGLPEAINERQIKAMREIGWGILFIFLYVNVEPP